ncbi:MAG: DUF3237 family protein [Actinobacteria bacterium]|nr:DUF3237 family protein [Actinomycetota bacterium]
MESEISSLALPTLRLRHVYRLRGEPAPPLEIGEGATGRRRLIAFAGGRFAGPEPAGEVLAAGGVRTPATAAPPSSSSPPAAKSCSKRPRRSSTANSRPSSATHSRSDPSAS